MLRKFLGIASILPFLQATNHNYERKCFGPVGGAEGDRTPDLLIANEALSQLSYSPLSTE
jgi:hypothetical protein